MKLSSEPVGVLDARPLIIIRRGATERFRLLQDVFAREGVEILWDRRVRQRRQRRASTAIERRGRERREAGGETPAEPPDQIRGEQRVSERRQRDEPRMPERRRRDRRGPVPTSWTALDCLVTKGRDPLGGVGDL